MVFLRRKGRIPEWLLISGIRENAKRHLIGNHAPVHFFFVTRRQVFKNYLANCLQSCPGLIG